MPLEMRGFFVVFSSVIGRVLKSVCFQKKFQQDYSLPGNFNFIFELEVTKKFNGKDKNWKIS